MLKYEKYVTLSTPTKTLKKKIEIQQIFYSLEIFKDLNQTEAQLENNNVTETGKRE